MPRNIEMDRSLTKSRLAHIANVLDAILTNSTLWTDDRHYFPLVSRPRGFRPKPLRRTVRKPLDLHGSHYPT